LPSLTNPKSAIENRRTGSPAQPDYSHRPALRPITNHATPTSAARFLWDTDATRHGLRIRILLSYPCSSVCTYAWSAPCPIPSYLTGSHRPACRPITNRATPTSAAPSTGQKVRAKAQLI